MKVKLITDSASDITPEDEKKYGIDIMPFDITLGDESLRERVDFTAPEFLEMIDKSEFLPKTSQITEIRFAEKFEHYYNEVTESQWLQQTGLMTLSLWCL